MRNKSLKAGDLINGEVFVAHEGWTIQRLADFFVSHDISAVPVVADDHKLVGVVSVSDVFRFNSLDINEKEAALSRLYRREYDMKVPEEDLKNWVKDINKSCMVYQIMTPDIITIDVNDDIKVVADIILEKHIHRVFVTRDGNVAGVITAMDLIRFVFHRSAEFCADERECMV